MFNSIMYVTVYSIKTLRPRIVEGVRDSELELGTQ